MNDQDKRAVESLCRIGLELDTIIASFPKFSKEELTAVYESIKGESCDRETGNAGISINCS